MTQYTIGIDCGSAFCKGALLGAQGIEALACIPTSWDLPETGKQTVKELLRHYIFSLDDVRLIPLITTGHGREKIEGRTNVVMELNALAKGGEFLCPGLKTIIDIGGQGCKVITVENGSVIDFQMNDMCAAGSGRFLEVIRQRLQIDSVLMEALLGQDKYITLNSTCVVFAESEIVKLLAHGVSKDAILGGVAASIAARVAALAEQISMQEPIALAGGLADRYGICKALSRVLDREIKPLQDGAYAGAIGAACLGFAGKNYKEL